jgi:hypothetical protein
MPVQAQLPWRQDTMMDSDVDEAQKEISEVTRRAIIDHFRVANVNWAGGLEDDEFLARLYDRQPVTTHLISDATGCIGKSAAFGSGASLRNTLSTPKGAGLSIQVSEK